MAGSQRFRFTLLQWQGGVAVLAICLAAIAFEASEEHGYVMALSYAVSLAGVAVFFHHARLSPWMWIAFAGTTGSFIMRTLYNFHMSQYSISLGVCFPLLIYLGLA